MPLLGKKGLSAKEADALKAKNVALQKALDRLTVSVNYNHSYSHQNILSWFHR